MIYGNYLKTQNISFKLVSFDSILFTQQISIKNICLPLKNNRLFSQSLRFSSLLHKEYDILAMINDNSLKTQEFHCQLVLFDSIRFALDVHTKNLHLSLKYALYRKIFFFRVSGLLYRAKVTIFDKTRRIC